MTQFGYLDPLVFWLLIAGQLAAGAITVGVIWAVNRWRTDDCGHDDLVAVAVSKTDSFATAIGAAAKTTDILWRCANCNHVESSTIPGLWTLAQLRAWGTRTMPEDWEAPDVRADTLGLPAGSDHG